MSPSPLPLGQPDGPRSNEGVQRVVQVLRLLIEKPADAGISVTETASALGVNKSTVSRLLGTLSASGLLIADPKTRRYHVGPLAFVVGTRFAGATVASSVEPLLRELAEVTHCTSQLGTLQGDSVIYLAVAQSDQRLRVMASPGDVRPAHASAIGKALLATLEEDEFTEFTRLIADSEGRLPQAGPGCHTNAQDLRNDIKATSVRGYSISNEESAPGVAALGTVVPSHREISFGVSIAFAKSLHPESQYEELRASLLALSNRISNLLVLNGPTSAGPDAGKGM